jgi:hypothetical protein
MHTIMDLRKNLSQNIPGGPTIKVSPGLILLLIASTIVCPGKGKHRPYPFNALKENNIPFMPTQVEAIRNGINPGLTLIVEPPGMFFVKGFSKILYCMCLLSKWMFFKFL